MNRLIYIFLTGLLFNSYQLFSQAGAGVKLGGNRQAYVDSIKNSEYKWTFPAWGRRMTKRGFDVPYSAGITLSSYVGSQKVNITDLQVGFNDNEPVPLDFVKFGEVNAKIQSVTVRPDVWILPFMDLYVIGGATYAQTDVSIVEPFEFSTSANFQGSTFGLGSTFAGGYHGIISIIDLNHTWTKMSNIEGTIQTTMFTPRIGYNFLFKAKPWRNVAFWVGAPGVFINRVTQGTIEVGDLKSTETNTNDLEGAANGTADWYQDLTPAQKLVVKQIAQAILDKINGLDPISTISYSLKKKPVSNWSMCLGAQYQISHRWQVRTEAGFLGGRKSLLLSGSYRLRL